MPTISTGNKFHVVAFSMEMPQAKRNGSTPKLDTLYYIIAQKGLISIAKHRGGLRNQPILANILLRLG